MPLAIVALILLAIVPVVLGLVRANEIACVRVRASAVRIARGRIPQGLFDDLADIVRSPAVGAATIRLVVEDRRVAVYVDGDLTPEQRQRIKNVVSLWPLPKLRGAPRPR